MATGLFLSLRRGFWQGVGAQFAGWAAVNMGIAWFGNRASRKRRAGLGKKADWPSTQVKEGAALRRLLWINFGLDVLYMAGGLLFMRRHGERARGTGFGIFLQGLFLFCFDGYHALRIEREIGDGKRR
jgi:hypothetical protein